MASTPPMQLVATPQTPPTPLHGAAYDRSNGVLRRSTRTASKTFAREARSTPEPPSRSMGVAQKNNNVSSPRKGRQVSEEVQSLPSSPQHTPKHKSTRRVQIISPSSPDSDPFVSNTFASSSRQRQPFFSATTTMSEGMLPTPVKTPKKKTIPKINAAARALFQDFAVGPDEVVSNTKRSRKSVRYNGFSLENVASKNQDHQGTIQIFTDSRDQIPQEDTNEANPFLYSESKPESSPKKMPRVSKRRKISGESKIDPQVQDAIEHDDGMVYVFRGRKVYRRFDDEGDDEEEITDAEELGLLQHTPNGTEIVKPLKTLTRKSIRPTRLFQKELKQRSKQQVSEEEAPTDIEETDDEAETNEHEYEKLTSTKTEPMHFPDVRRLRSSMKPVVHVDDDDDVAEQTPKAKKNKKSSPFDSWRRVKAGGAPSSAKGKKRAAPDDSEVETKQVASTSSKKVKI